MPSNIYHVVQTDCSIFVDERYLDIYAQEKTFKVVVLQYQAADLLSVCFIARQNHVLDPYTQGYPATSYTLDEMNYDHPELIENLFFKIFDHFSNSAIVKHTQAELKQFGLKRQDIPDHVLLESQIDKGFDRYKKVFNNETHGFIYIKKTQRKALERYIEFLNVHGLELDIPDTREAATPMPEDSASLLRLAFPGIEKNPAAFAEMLEQMGSPQDLEVLQIMAKAQIQNDFGQHFSPQKMHTMFDEECDIKTYFPIVMKYLFVKNDQYHQTLQVQLELLRHKLPELLEQEKTLCPFLKKVDFHQAYSVEYTEDRRKRRTPPVAGAKMVKDENGKCVAFFDAPLKTLEIQCQINMLRAQVLAHSDDSRYYRQILTPYYALKEVTPYHEPMRSINEMTLHYLDTYFDRLNAAYPWRRELNELIHALYDMTASAVKKATF